MRYGPHTEDTKVLMRAKMLGRKRSPEDRLEMCVGHRVVKLFKPELYEAHRELSRAKMRANWQDPAFLERWQAGREKYRANLRSKEKAADRRQQIEAMLAAGMTGKAIAEKLGVCPQRVSQLVKAHEAAKARGEAA